MPIEILHPEQLHGLAKDITGDKYGKLEALVPVESEKNGVDWLFKCDCGNLTVKDARWVRSGNTRSCGCLMWNNLKGQRFSRLLVLEQTDERRQGSIVWKCQCDCGVTHYARSDLLRAGDIQSCGCYAAEQSRKRLTGKTGKESIAWQGGITAEYDRIRTSPEFKQWREQVYKRDDYTCQKCDESPSNELNAHHILPFDLHPEYRMDVDNGITLCENCHKDFHSEYGRTYCDRVDLLVWLGEYVLH